MKRKTVFIDGEISPEFIADSIRKHQAKTHIGGHQIFLGQVRADIIDDKKVTGIEFSANKDMAHEVLHTIREDTFGKFDLSCMHIYHSLGFVPTGSVCFFVFVSAPHRKHLVEASEYIVNRVKKEVPVFGKEFLEDDSFSWKLNLQS